MITKYVPRDLSETIDAISWAVGYAPGFKGRFTLDEVFDDIVHSVETVKAKTRSTEKLGIIEQAMQKLSESKTAFVAEQMKPAHQALFDAGQLLRSLRR